MSMNGVWIVGILTLITHVQSLYALTMTWITRDVWAVVAVGAIARETAVLRVGSAGNRGDAAATSASALLWFQRCNLLYMELIASDKRDIYIFGINIDIVKGNLIGWEEEKLQRDNA